MTEEMLEDLMSNMDLDLISGDFMEQDLERKRAAWLATFIREKNWRRDAFEASVQQQKEQDVIQGQGQQREQEKRRGVRRNTDWQLVRCLTTGAKRSAQT